MMHANYLGCICSYEREGKMIQMHVIYEHTLEYVEGGLT